MAAPKDWPERFLAHLAETCDVKASAEVAGIGRRQVYRRKASNPEFAEAWEAALLQASEDIEASFHIRATDPKDPQSHSIGMFLLKAHRPDKYRERQSISHEGHVPVTIVNRFVKPDPIDE